MTDTPLYFSPDELAVQRNAERGGAPFLVYRDGEATQRVLPLAGQARLVVGRTAQSDLLLSWDSRVSRAHAVLESIGGRWSVSDEGLSRNGTFLNDERVRGRRRLDDGDLLRFGNTPVLYRNPTEGDAPTPIATNAAQLIRLSDAQRRVLVALCRTAAPGEMLVTASNAEIALELSVSVEAVRSQLKALFRRFDVPELPASRKRAELAKRALESGAVTNRDLTEERRTPGRGAERD